jgi:signal transduction histidine kinase
MMHGLDANMERTVANLVRRIEKLSKINAALMDRVERSMDQQANAFSLFQTAIALEAQVRVRTEELKSALDKLESANVELIAARDAAEKANRFKTRFFTAVGHDLLQPLHAARLSLSAMSEDIKPEQRERLVAQVDHALSSIQEILRTILDLSKLDAGVIKPQQQSVALGEVFNSLVFDLGPIARAKDLMLIHRATDLMVLSDPLMLRRILQNLLANAVNYTNRGTILLAARLRGNRVHVQVWDTGPGIADAEQARIFEEFQRGASSDQGQGGGFGLGLSIVKRMVEALGARIELASRIGHGTRFSVIMPYAGRAAAPNVKVQDVPPGAAYGFKEARVVIIDNDTAILRAMAALMEKWSCEVRLAVSLRDIDALIEQEAEFRPRIVLADYHLERAETGLDAIARLRRAWGQDLPAIIITADHGVEVEANTAAAGCEILKKPVKPAELRALMQHLLS